MNFIPFTATPARLQHCILRNRTLGQGASGMNRSFQHEKNFTEGKEGKDRAVCSCKFSHLPRATTAHAEWCPSYSNPRRLSWHCFVNVLLARRQCRMKAKLTRQPASAESSLHPSGYMKRKRNITVRPAWK